MKRGLLITLTIIIFLGSLSFVAHAQSSSNKGKDFWLGYGNHVRDWSSTAAPAKMSLYITSDVNTNVTVEVKGIYLETKAVSANGITIFDIPDGAKLSNEGKSDRGIHVTAEKPVVVYSHIFASNISGATLVLPTNTLGKDYYSINYTQTSNEQNSYSYFFVVAVEDDTEVEIIPSATTKGGWLPGSVNRVTLQKGQIYQVLGAASGAGGVSSGSDLTGSRIRSISTTLTQCKRIAVFSGSGKISIGCTPGAPGSADNLYQQVYPTQAWGKKFITAPLKSRNYDVFRIVKSDPLANVTVNGVAIPAASFTNQFFYDFSSQSANVISSDKPIQVAQYAVTQNKSINCTNLAEPTGDPEMIFLNPIEQNIESITLYSANQFLIVSHFINVVIETAFVSSFKLDNAAQSASFAPVPGAPEYSYAQLSVGAGVHNLSADKGFNAIAYGFGSAESYGYSAGTNVKSLTIQARNQSTNLLVENLCINEAFNFSIKLKYKTDRLLWDLGNGSTKEILNPVAVDNNPPDGIYEYKFPDPMTYSVVKDYLITVTANNPSADGCGTTELIEVSFSVFDPPISKFTVSPVTCEGSGILFTDKSDGLGGALKKWLWNFSDGTTSPEQNPTHIFTKAGKYTVTLIAYGESGCASSVFTQDIIVNKLPLANFAASFPLCDNKSIVFTDASTSAEGKIVKWIWNPGDGSVPTELSSNSPFTYEYKATGTYKASLTVVTEYGCESFILEKPLIIKPTPVVTFVVPEVCISDQFAFFTTNSTIADGSALTYLWDFGDALATAANPGTSTAKNAAHRYTKAGNYKVTLTVRSQDGCESALTQSFTVNGATPVASFVIANPQELCSNKEVVFTNTSTVDFGTLSKVEWFFDYGNLPTEKLVDEDPLPGKQYSFPYPIFTFPASRTVKVRMLAYSGGSCRDEEIQELTLLAAPKVNFASLANVCLEVPPYQFTQAIEANNQSGTGRYYGKGVSTTGLFSPALAGIGSHTIKYVFTALNGCADSLSQDITVMPTPTVYAGKDTLLHEGTWIQLKPAAAGSNLTYKWFPSTGLSRDDILNPMASPPDDVVYTLTVTSDQGCVASDQVVIKVLKLPVVPNAFTPNGDGINDVWNIKNLANYPKPTIQVFNRYGDRIFSSFSADEITWDGKFNGTDTPVGTYYYIIRPGSGRGAISGSVTILR